MNNMDVLTAEQCYQQDTAPYAFPKAPRMDPQTHLVQRALAGEQAARDALLLGLQSYVQYWARRYARAYHWASPRVDYLELVSEANLAMVEHLDTALTKEHPPSSLACIGRYAMVHYCHRYASLIAIPYTDQAQTCEVVSLDLPRSHDSSETLGESLPAPAFQETSRDNSSAVFPLTHILPQALALLPKQQQQVITRYYGLGEHGPESTSQISQNVAAQPLPASTVRAYLRAARSRLDLILRASLLTPGVLGVYTRSQAAQVLGVSYQALSNLTTKHHITTETPNLYPRHAIDALARQRANKRAQLAQKAECA